MLMTQSCVLLATITILLGPTDFVKGDGPVPERIVAAWEKAGAHVGWISWYEFGNYFFRRGGEAKKGEVLAFRISDCQKAVLATLPQPERDFALICDAGPLPQLGSFAQLKYLALDGPGITDADLEGLSG